MGKIFESTPAYQKGLIGEEIIKKRIEELGLLVRRPDDKAKSGASVVDFYVEMVVEEYDYHEYWFVEVKVKSPRQYAYGRFPVYTFPKSQIELYERYAKEKNLEIKIFIVDEQRESIFWRELNGLEDPIRIEDKIFPLDVEQSNGIYRYYHVEQFVYDCKIDFTDLERLRLIKFSDSDKKIFKPLENSEQDISAEKLFEDSRAAIEKYLNLKLPENLQIKNKKIPALIKTLRQRIEHIPTCLFYEIYHAVHNVNMKKSIQSFVNAFYPLLDEIKHDRQKAPYRKIETIVIKGSMKKISELKAPNNTLLEIFEIVEHEPHFFVKYSELAISAGYGRLVCANPHSKFGDSIKAASKFYECSSKILLVPVKDISKIVNEYAFNRADEISKYELAKEFLEWWEEAAEPYLESPAEEEKSLKRKNYSFTAKDVKNIGEIADSLIEVMGTTRQEALQAAIEIKSRELNLDLTALLKLIK